MGRAATGMGLSVRLYRSKHWRQDRWSRRRAALAIPRVALFTNVGVHFFGSLELAMSWQTRNDVYNVPFLRLRRFSCLRRRACRLDSDRHVLSGREIWRAYLNHAIFAYNCLDAYRRGHVNPPMRHFTIPRSLSRHRTR